MQRAIPWLLLAVAVLAVPAGLLRGAEPERYPPRQARSR